MVFASGLVESPLVPIAIGVLGLGIGNFVGKWRTLFGTPKHSPGSSRTWPVWGTGMEGFTQLVTGCDLMVSLSSVRWRWHEGDNDESDGNVALAFLAIPILRFHPWCRRRYPCQDIVGLSRRDLSFGDLQSSRRMGSQILSYCFRAIFHGNPADEPNPRPCDECGPLPALGDLISSLSATPHPVHSTRRLAL